MRTITFYNPMTGKLGPIISESDEAIADKILNYPYFFEGSLDTEIFEFDIKERKDAISEFEMKEKRNNILDSLRWTVMPDSPLTETNKNDWLMYLKNLQGIFKDGIPEHFEWPNRPEFIYEETL